MGHCVDCGAKVRFGQREIHARWHYRVYRANAYALVALGESLRATVPDWAQAWKDALEAHQDKFLHPDEARTGFRLGDPSRGVNLL